MGNPAMAGGLPRKMGNHGGLPLQLVTILGSIQLIREFYSYLGGIICQAEIIFNAEYGIRITE